MKISAAGLKRLVQEELFYRQFHRDTLASENRGLLLQYFADDEDSLDGFLTKVNAAGFSYAADEWNLGLDQQAEIAELLGL